MISASTNSTIGNGPRGEGAAAGDSRLARIAEVDAAVRSVLRGDDRRAAGVEEAIGGSLFAERLFSLRHAEGLPAHWVEVRIAPGTVVTPLARDHLKRRGITLRQVTKGDGDDSRPKRAGSWAFAVERAAESGVVAALRRALLEDDWTELEASLESAARWVADDPRRGALLLADEASVAVWRACRQAGVRAAAAADCDAVARAIRRLGVNLLVVEPRGTSISLCRGMARTFRRGGAPEPPPEILQDAGAGKECRCGSPR